MLFTAEESWQMSEPEKVVAIIKECGLWMLGNWDGCCCSNFKIRNVEIDISCGKGRDQGIWVSSYSMDYDDKSLLRQIADEVLRQLRESSNRVDRWAVHFEPYKSPPIQK